MKRAAFYILFLALCAQAYTQPPKVKNLQRFDAKKYHFGFSLGFNSASFALHRRGFQFPKDSLANIEVVNQSGFNLGIVTDLHLHKYFNLRFVPTLVFGQRNLNFKFLDPQGEPYIEERIIESTYLDFPIILKYRSARLNNFAAYVLAGFKPSIDLASNERVDNRDIPESIIKLRRNTTSAEIGFGTDFFLPYFKFAIEAKMSYGLQNAMVRDNTELSTPIERIVPKMFILSFLFEG